MTGTPEELIAGALGDMVQDIATLARSTGLPEAERTIASMVVTADRTLRALTDDYEVIVVNDGSPDHTAEVLADLQSRYPNLRVVTHAKNRGYGGALRSGFWLDIAGIGQQRVAGLAFAVAGWRRERPDALEQQRR